MTEPKTLDRVLRSNALLCCDSTEDPPMLPRELDCHIAERYLGWKWTQVGKDYDGKNECMILTPDGILPMTFELPRKGIVGGAYFVPEFSRDLQHALMFAKKMGFDHITIGTCELSFQVPELIVRSVIRAVSST